LSPDSPETRLRELEQDVSALKQQVTDTVEDVRAFAPALASQAEFRATLAHFGNDLTAIQLKLVQLEDKLAAETEARKTQREEDRREREKGQEARAKEDRTNRTLLWVAAIGLVGTLLLAIAAVVGALLGA
jgi:hypothetical protein